MTVNAGRVQEIYSEQLNSLRAVQSRDERRDRLYGYAKLALAGATLIAAGVAVRYLAALAAIAALIAAFVFTAVLHERRLTAIVRRSRAIDYIERGLARLGGRWEGRGPSGERYLDPGHVYARDLDIFGHASLFQYLCTARTRAGEDVLARWLLHAADPGEIRLREESVCDLAGRTSFREELASAGESVRNAVHPESLATWGEGSAVLGSPTTRALTTAFGLLWIGCVVLSFLMGSVYPALLGTLMNFAWAHWIHARLEAAAASVETAGDDLKVLAEVLALAERQEFAAAQLRQMQALLQRRGVPPSKAIRKLARLAETIQTRHSMLARPLDLVTFWSAQLIFMAESWRREFGPSIRSWLEAIGELEALASLATFAFEHPHYTTPEFVQDGPWFEAEALAHPLLPLNGTAENDVRFDSERQLMVLSGPNMAGKSTFIRSIGVNAVLAQCGSPVRARRLRMSTLRVAASICILDSLSGGVSRFYAEIRRLKLIRDLADDPVPVLFLLDELLSGTNSHDRFEGTRHVLRALIDRQAIGIVSTHDLALTQIPEEMGGRAFNAHFEDRLEDGKLVFDYTLKPGIVKTSNALKLMRAIGLGV